MVNYSLFLEDYDKVEKLGMGGGINLIDDKYHRNRSRSRSPIKP